MGSRCQGGDQHGLADWRTAGWRFNALYGNCRAADGHNQRIWFFVGARFVGTDSPKSSAEIVGLW